MRVTIVGPAYPLRGGIAHHVYWLNCELRDRGHSTQVISFHRLYPRFLFPGVSAVDSSNLRLDPAAVPLLDCINPVTWVEAFKYIKSFAPDLVLIQWWSPLFSVSVGTLIRLCKTADLKCILECHNVIPHETTFLDLVLSDFAFSPADGFITHSQKDKQDLLSLQPQKRVSIAPLPALKEFLRASNCTRAGRTILFFGLVRRYKGLDVLLMALRKVLSELACTLVVAGEFYESEERYLRLIREYGIESHVKIDNRYVPNEEVSALFEEADVLVLPYLRATQSGVAMTALANGLPIIASKTGGLSEIVIHNVNGLLVPPGDPDALAAAIRRYFTGGLGPKFREAILASPRTGAARCLGYVIEQMAEW